MKRFYFVLLVIIALAIAIVPYIYGSLFKSQFTNMVAVVNQNEVVQIDVLTYSHGWMNSSASIKIQPGKQVQQNPKIKALVETGQAGFTLNLKIHHGPIVYNPIQHRLSFAYGSINGFLSLPSQIEGFIFGKKQPDGFMQFDIIAGFGDNWFSRYESPATILPGPTGVSARWDGMSAEINASLNKGIVDKYYSKILLNAFVISSEGNPPGIPHVNIKPITYEGSMDNAKIKVAKGVLSIPSIVIENPSTVLAIDHFRQNHTTTLNTLTNKANVNADITWNNITIPNYMPFPLDKSSIFVTAKDINLNEFKEMIDYTRSIKRKMTNEELSHLQSLIPKIISPTSAMSLDIGITTPEGVLILNGKINWPDALPAQVSLPGLMQVATATVAIRISAPLLISLVNKSGVILPLSSATPVQSTASSLPAPGAAVTTEAASAEITQASTVATPAEKIQRYVDQGYLIKDNNDYVTSLLFNKGGLVANGKVVKFNE